MELEKGAYQKFDDVKNSDDVIDDIRFILGGKCAKSSKFNFNFN